MTDRISVEMKVLTVQALRLYDGIMWALNQRQF